MIKVAILDDHMMVLKGLETMLSSAKEIQIVGTFGLGNELLHFLKSSQPDVLLLDISLPDSNGIELCKQLTKLYPEMGVLGLSNHGETSFVKNMMRNGAKGYLLKNTTKEELVQAIKLANVGQNYLPPSLQNKVLNELLNGQKSTDIIKLTRREKEVLQYVSEEMTSVQMAEKMFVSPKTVETHRMNLMNKLGVKNSVGLIKKAIEKGLLDS